jgi:hypothetical protein
MDYNRYQVALYKPNFPPVGKRFHGFYPAGKTRFYPSFTLTGVFAVQQSVLSDCFYWSFMERETRLELATSTLARLG